MNKRKLSFEYFLLSLLIGTLVVIQFKSPLQSNVYNSFVSREIVSQINKEKMELNNLENKLLSVNNEYKKLQKKYEGSNLGLTKLEKEKYTHLRMVNGLENIHGEGIIIKLEPVDMKNIAFIMDTNRILLKLVNNIKIAGGESISINNQVITAGSEIVLAGNHINVNNVPISQPYEIKAIGNEKALYRYFTEKDTIMLVLEKNHGIKAEISKSRKINIPALGVKKDLEYIEKVSS